MKTIVNILGVSRSGSTMLDVMLGNGDRCFSCGEVDAMIRPYRKHHFSVECSCGFKDCKVWSKILGISDKNIHENVFKATKVDYVIDSSKSLSWLIDQYRWLPESINIVNIVSFKQPIDLAFSLWKRGLAGNLAKDTKYISRLIGLKVPFVSVDYRQLVQNPQKKISKICKVIDMPYWKGKEKFWLSDAHFLFGSMGVRQQVAMRKSLIYKEKEWSDKFSLVVPELEKQFSQDKLISKTIERLKELEVDNIKTPIMFPRIKKIALPSWYYMHRFKRFVAKRFPRDYVAKDVSPIYGKKDSP